ncbi:MAG: hypothetical protein ACYCZD_12555 [Rhodanobacter sp.]
MIFAIGPDRESQKVAPWPHFQGFCDRSLIVKIKKAAIHGRTIGFLRSILDREDQKAAIHGRTLQ